MLLQGGGDRIPVRLKNAILRILSRSLTKYRSYYLPQMPLPGQVDGPDSRHERILC